MEDIINSHFESEKFLIIQKELAKGRSLSIKIYNPLSPNKEKDEERPFDLCLDLFIDNLEKYIDIEYLTNCGINNGGTLFVKKVIDFAKKNEYKKIILEDDSFINIHSKDKDGNIINTFEIPFGKFKYLKDGISWYGKLGFTNKLYERSKEDILKFINQPLVNIVESVIHSNINSIERLINLEYIGIESGISIESIESLKRLFYMDKHNIISSMREKISFVDIAENMKLCELFKYFENFLKTACKNNEFLEDDKKTKENVRNIIHITEYLYNVMANKLSLGDLFFGNDYLEYII
jgi:hypothetical protein